MNKEISSAELARVKRFQDKVENLKELSVRLEELFEYVMYDVLEWCDNCITIYAHHTLDAMGKWDFVAEGLEVDGKNKFSLHYGGEHYVCDMDVDGVIIFLKGVINEKQKDE